MKNMRNANKISAGKPEAIDHLGDLGICGRYILKWI
jgi:hypothetical protein